jgi:hypothetical protein
MPNIPSPVTRTAQSYQTGLHHRAGFGRKVAKDRKEPLWSADLVIGFICMPTCLPLIDPERCSRRPELRLRDLRGLLVVALTLGVLCVAPTVAGATGPVVRLTIHQASGSLLRYFKLNAPPGSVASAGSLTVTNPTGHAVKVRLDPVNGLTDSMLGADYALAGKAGSESTRWLDLGARRLTIAAHSGSSVAVAILVPGSAKPGDYLSGIAVQSEERAQVARAAHGMVIGETYRYVVGVEASVPGPRRAHIHFTGARVVRWPASVVFLISASNDGNVILKNVYGNARITQGSRQVMSMTMPPGTFVSHTSIQIPLSTPHEHPKAGTVYRVRAKLVYSGGVAYLDTYVTFGRHAAYVQSQYTPRRVRGAGGSVSMAALSGAIAGLLALVLLAVWWRRRRRQPLSPKATLALLRRRLADSGAHGRPLSLIYFDVVASRGVQRRLVKVLRPALRGADAIGDLGNGRLLVILPETGDELARGLASELTAVLHRAGLGHTVGPTHVLTAPAVLDAEQLIAQVNNQRDDDQPTGYRAAGTLA